VLIDTHANPDTQRDSLMPDISVHADDNVPDAEYMTDFSKMESFDEFKLAEASDPFREPENFHFKNDSDDARLVCGQLVLYVAAHTGSQFRVYLYTESR
jgi:hypothetical protein